MALGRLALLATLLCAAPGVLAEPPEAVDAEVPATPPEPAPLSTGPRLDPIPGPWRPPLHDVGADDWLVLDSGEWLRGSIDLISDEVVYFDSSELDDLEIDWDDVEQLRSARHNTYRFGDEIVTGTAAMRDGVVRVDTGSEVREFPRDDLLSMIEGDLREINYWSLDLSLGVTLRAGNSEQTDVTGRLEIERETPLTRTTLVYLNNYSVVERNEIANNQRLTGEFAYYVSRRTFLLAPTAELYRDRIQNIDLRATIGAGVGYDVLDRAKAEWSVVLGGGYQRTQFDEVAFGEDRTDDDAAAIFATSVELDPAKDVDWDTTYRLQAVVTDFDKTNHHLLSVLSVEIWGPLDLDVSFAWDRIEGPTRDGDGQLPERNDFRLTVGLGIEL